MLVSFPTHVLLYITFVIWLQALATNVAYQMVL